MRVEHADLTAATQIAIDAWNAKLELTCPGVSLTLVNGDVEADITVRWGSLPAGYRDRLACEQDGEITMNRAQYTEQNTAKTARGRPLYTYEAALQHELGHAMGAEHSGSREDAMYPKTYPGPAPELSTHDVWTVCQANDGLP